MLPPNSGQVYQSPASNPGQPFTALPSQSNQVPPGQVSHMLPGQSSQTLTSQPNQAPGPLSQMPPGQPSQMLPNSQPNQIPSGQPNQMQSGQLNQMAPGRQLYSAPGPSPSQPFEVQPMIPGQPLQTSGSNSSQPYQIPVPTPGPTYEVPSQNTSQAYQFPPVNSVSSPGGPQQGVASKPGALYQSSQQYQAASYPGQPYQMPTSNPDQSYQPPSSNSGHLYPDTKLLPGQPMQSPLLPPHASQAYPTPASAPGQPYQAPSQVQPHQPYQPLPQSPGQGPPQPIGQTIQATGQAGYQPYQAPGQPPSQVQHSEKAPIPAVVGAPTPQHQQHQQVMPPSPARPQPPGVQPPNHQSYQTNYNYSPPYAQGMPGNRTIKSENQGHGPTSVGQPFQMTDGRAQSYTQAAPPQATHWVPPFANPSPSSVYGHMTSPYPGTPPVPFTSEQSMIRQPQSQNLPAGYPAGSYPVGSGYTVPVQQPVPRSRQPFAQSPPQTYGSAYHQPGLPEPRSQYIARRSPLSDAKINSIDTLLCHAEELEPRVLSFSGRRG